MLDTVDHVILAVRDLEAATRDLAAVLGRPASWRGAHPGSGTANALFRLDNTYVELLAPEGEGPVGAFLAARLDAAGEGLVGVAFGTDDAEACHADFVRAGLGPAAVEPGIGRDEDSGAFREWKRVPLPLSSTRGLLLFAIEHTSPEALLPKVPPLGAPEACVARLDHVVVRTPSPDGARALYGDALGLRLALEQRFERFDMHALFFRVGGVTVEVVAPLEPPADAADTDVFYGLAWGVGDVEAAAAEMTERGVEVSARREGRKPGTRVFTVKSRTCGVPTLVIGPEA